MKRPLLQAQALPPPPGARGWLPPLHRLHSSSALLALASAPGLAPGVPALAPGAPNQAPGAPPHPLARAGSTASESRKRSYAAAMEDGELLGLPPGTPVPRNHAWTSTVKVYRCRRLN